LLSDAPPRIPALEPGRNRRVHCSSLVRRSIVSGAPHPHSDALALSESIRGPQCPIPNLAVVLVPMLQGCRPAGRNANPGISHASPSALQITPGHPFCSCAYAWFRRTIKVSDGSQPPLMLDFSLSESAGSRSLHRLVRHSGQASRRPPPSHT